MLNTGEMLNNRYRIVKLLGHGGFGAVYRAWDVNLSGPCAIKENFETSPAAQSQFAREASILYNLRHPNLPKVTDHFSIPGQGQYLVMEFIEGQNLQEMIDQAGGPLPEAQALSWIFQVCDAVNYLHHRTPPIIHRDIKPANVRITPEGVAYLVDFGIAKLYDPDRRTTLGARAVTPGYSPFEQYGQKSTDIRTDVYSLGATLYAALTGKVPLESIERVGGATLPHPSTFNPKISPQVEAAILKAMALMPEHRFQEAGQLREAISSLTETQVSIASSHPMHPAPTQVVQPTNLQHSPLTTTAGDQAGDVPATAEMVQAPIRPRKVKKTIWIFLGAGITVIVAAIAGLLLGYQNIKNYLADYIPTATRQVVSATSTPFATSSSPPKPQTSSFDCTDPLGCVTVPAGTSVNIAYALVISGPNESLGIDARNGIDLAVRDKGQILGHDIRLTGVDDGCSPESGNAAGRVLAANPEVVAVIGTSCSSAAREAIPILSEAGFTIVSPSSTAPDLTQEGSPYHFPGFFRTSVNDAFQGRAAARFAWERLGVKRAATVHDGSIYSVELQEMFAQEFSRLGGEITAQQSIDPNQTEMQAIVERVAPGNPEIIYIPVFQPAGSLLIHQFRRTPELSRIRLMGGDGLFSDETVETAGEEVEGFLVSSPFVAGPAYDEFVRKYKEAFGTDPLSAYHAHAYDAAMLIFAAIEKIAVRTEDSALHIPRQSLREAMASTRGFKGVTGILSCDPNGDCANPSIAIYEFHPGQFPPVKIWP
jgi:branched-chain amino acid transport system substrate-binding protein